MSIIRVTKNTNYSQISNQPLNNTELSFQAKGLLCYLLSRPNHWQINVSHLVTVSTDGRDAIYSTIKELEKAGYIVKEANRKAGKFVSFDYMVYEQPLPAFPDTAKPDTEKPDISKDLVLVNTESSKGPVEPAAQKIEKPIRERKIEFCKLVIDWVKEHNGKYPKLMIVEFVKYWLEQSIHKKKTKLRFEGQEYFDTGRRLSTWFKQTKDLELSKYWESEAKVEALNTLLKNIL